MAKKDRTNETTGPRFANRKAFHDFHILEKLECGIRLTGSEAKAARDGRVSLAGSFAHIEPATMELWLHGADIGTCDYAPAAIQHDPKRSRKLLVHRKQIINLMDRTAQGHMALIPLSMYFNSRGLAKIELAVGRGKTHSDKRQTLRDKDDRRSMERGMSRKRIR